MITNGAGLRALHAAVPFRSVWNGRCDECDQEISNEQECWFWSGALNPIVHSNCFVAWVKNLPVESHFMAAPTIHGGYAELANPVFKPIDPSKLPATREQPQSQASVPLGGFMDYVNDWSDEVSHPATRLNELYDSISIWEVYKRLLPDKPHKPYRPDGETSVACPHETGRNSLSMWINDAKGLYFCAHAWEGGNKMALYCEIRGLTNTPNLFHKLKQLMVLEFRNEDPYSTAEL